MDPLIAALNQIASAVKKSDRVATLKAIELARECVAAHGVRPPIGGETALLQNLDEELKIWHSKIDVILKEPIARQGMAKHATYWVEKIQKDSWQKN